MTGLEIARAALADRTAWVVGGWVRDALRGVQSDDIDLVVEGDVAAAARALAQAGGGVAFELSDDFGAWRVVARDRSWQADLNPIRGGSLTADLALRDFTVNAIAEPLAGGPAIDPLGGAGDLRRGVLRFVGAGAVADDPLRALRLVRLACELGLEPDAQARGLARGTALAAVASERVFGELKRIMACDRAAAGIELLDELELLDAVLPGVRDLHGVEQNRYHHRDVYGHTLEALETAMAIGRDPAAVLGAEHADAVAELLREPLADGLDRNVALRFGALLHDIAKPPTRAVLEGGRIIFPGHDALGAELVRELLGGLRASGALVEHVAALTRHHLRLGFLVHEQPLRRRVLYRYLKACGQVAPDVTLLSVADRLATRGDRAEESIERHTALARAVLGDALRWRRDGPPAPPVRGDRLARELGIAPGPQLGELLSALAEARFAGEISSPEEALALARGLVT